MADRYFWGSSLHPRPSLASRGHFSWGPSLASGTIDAGLCLVRCTVGKINWHYNQYPLSYTLGHVILEEGGKEPLPHLQEPMNAKPRSRQIYASPELLESLDVVPAGVSQAFWNGLARTQRIAFLIRAGRAGLNAMSPEETQAFCLGFVESQGTIPTP